jgi:hypothetical protein
LYSRITTLLVASKGPNQIQYLRCSSGKHVATHTHTHTHTPCAHTHDHHARRPTIACNFNPHPPPPPCACPTTRMLYPTRGVAISSTGWFTGWFSSLLDTTESTTPPHTSNPEWRDSFVGRSANHPPEKDSRKTSRKNGKQRKNARRNKTARQEQGKGGWGGVGNVTSPARVTPHHNIILGCSSQPKTFE